MYRVGVLGKIFFYLTSFTIPTVVCSYRCRGPSGQLDNDEDIYERRSRDHTDFLCTMCEMGVLYDNYGIVGDIIVRIWQHLHLLSYTDYSQPFTNEFPRADVHEIIAPDLLHQIIKGTFKDHLVSWVEELLMHIHRNNKTKVCNILDDIDHR